MTKASVSEMCLNIKYIQYIIKVKLFLNIVMINYLIILRACINTVIDHHMTLATIWIIQYLSQYSHLQTYNIHI